MKERVRHPFSKLRMKKSSPPVQAFKKSRWVQRNSLDKLMHEDRTHLTDRRTQRQLAHDAHAARGNHRRLTVVFALTLAYMIAEAVGGFLTNSLALLSDAGHMLTDAAALLLALMAIWFASRPVTPEKTYGYHRMEILAALANGIGLAAISLLIFYEALQRLASPEPVRGSEVAAIAIGGLIVNLISAWLLHDASEESLNVRGAFLHVLGDAMGSIGAIVSGLLIWWKGWTLADPIVSVMMCVLIVYGAWQLIRASVNILLEGAPSHIDVEAVIAAIGELPGVAEVHDLHIWTISSGKEALSAHVIIEPGVSSRAALEAVQERLKTRFNIGHVTIQVESREDTHPTGRLYQIQRRT